MQSINQIYSLRTAEDRREHPYCKECKLSTEKANKDWNKTIGKCNGIYSDPDFVEASNIAGISKDEARELLDPSEWIYRHLGMQPFWYQDRALKCTSIRRTLRWGRRTGKTESVSAWLIFMACTNAGKKILCVTPAKSQAKEINDRIHKLLEESVDVKHELTRSVQQPYYENVFANGSRIRIFVAGTSAGAGAGTHIRGQEGDIIFIDEMDYLDDDAALAILPILSDPHRQGDPVSFIASSTPTGEEKLFFRLCNRDEYRELHFPSYCRPDWDEDKEQEARSQSKTEAGYQHEYLAEWGTKSDGVFKRNQILQAGQQFRYWNQQPDKDNADWPEMKPFPNHWKYIMGVDWNGPGNGTRIAIVGYDYTRNKWILVYRESVSADEFSYHYSIQRMVELNRIWKCNAAYIDAGFGQMQDETLRGIGRQAKTDQAQHRIYEYPDLMWDENLNTVDFGSWIEYDTIEDGKPVKKKIPVKNYMVENFQRFFDNKTDKDNTPDFWYPKDDQEFKQQLMGYSIARQSSHGHPIYKADPEFGDHDLDACMLALFGFAKEFDAMLKGRVQMSEFYFFPANPVADKPIADPLSAPIEHEKQRRELLIEEQARKEKMQPSSVPSRKIAPKKEDLMMLPGTNTVITVKTRPDPGTVRRGLFSGGAKPTSRTGWMKTKANGRSNKI